MWVSNSRARRQGYRSGSRKKKVCFCLLMTDPSNGGGQRAPFAPEPPTGPKPPSASLPAGTDVAPDPGIGATEAKRASSPPRPSSRPPSYRPPQKTFPGLSPSALDRPDAAPTEARQPSSPPSTTASSGEPSDLPKPRSSTPPRPTPRTGRSKTLLGVAPQAIYASPPRDPDSTRPSPPAGEELRTSSGATTAEPLAAAPAQDEPPPTPAPNVVSAPAPPPAEPERPEPAASGVDADRASDESAPEPGGIPTKASHAPELSVARSAAADQASTSDEDRRADAVPKASRAQRSSGRALGWAALCVVVLGGAWLVLGRQSPEPGSPTAASSSPAPAQPNPVPAPAASHEESTTRAPAAAEQGAAATPGSPTARTPSAQPAEGSNANTISVTLDVRPVGSQVFRKGRYVGKTPLVIALKPGEKRAFEVSKRGYAPQKVVLDGRKTEVLLGLRPLNKP
jgi:hypothetical protein